MRLPDLTPQQREKIRAIQERTRREIDAVLTPAQREQLQQSRERFGPPRGPQGYGPQGRGPQEPGGRNFGPPPFDGPPHDGPFGRPFGDEPGGRGPGFGGPRGGPGGGPGGAGPRGRGGMGEPSRRQFEPRQPGLPLGPMEWMLDLKADQQNKIKAILNAAQKNEQTVRSNTTLDPEQRFDQLRSIHDSARRQIEAVLTPAQREKMQQSREQFGPRPAPSFDGPPRGGPDSGW
jgi:Spy/CpxP family protein refolding chaperone